MAVLESPLIILSFDQATLALTEKIVRSCPDIAYVGRLDETLLDLWHCFWQLPSARRERTERLESVRMKTIASFGEQDDARQMIAVRDAERLEKARVYTLIRAVLGRAYAIEARSERLWGYGIACAPDADAPVRPILAHLFPNARYLGILPNPFDCVGLQSIDRDVLRTALTDWGRLYDAMVVTANESVSISHTVLMGVQGGVLQHLLRGGDDQPNMPDEGPFSLDVPTEMKATIDEVQGFEAKINALNYRLVYRD